jgi:hypothetical protein
MRNCVTLTYAAGRPATSEIDRPGAARSRDDNEAGGALARTRLVQVTSLQEG